ncbi:MAG: hypothetical protein AAF153_00370 [Pseudomonadota bacterium]
MLDSTHYNGVDANTMLHLSAVVGGVIVVALAYILITKCKQVSGIIKKQDGYDEITTTETDGRNVNRLHRRKGVVTGSEQNVKLKIA